MTRPRKCVAGSRDSDGWGDSEAEPQPRGKAARGSALGAAANLGRRQRLPWGLSRVAGGQPGLVASSRGGLRGQPAPRSLRPVVTGQSGGAHGPSQDTDSLGRFDGETGRDLPTTRSWGVGGFRDPPESKARRWESRSEDQSRRGQSKDSAAPKVKASSTVPPPSPQVSDFCSETRARERRTGPSGPDPDREPQRDRTRRAEGGAGPPGAPRRLCEQRALLTVGAASKAKGRGEARSRAGALGAAGQGRGARGSPRRLLLWGSSGPQAGT